jgi:hypothetical protein
MDNEMKFIEEFERLEEADREVHKLYAIEREIEKQKKSGGENLEELLKQKNIQEERLRNAIIRYRD